jgi:hypothetical protein
MLLFLDGNRRNRMPFAIFFYGHSDDDRKHDKRDNALFFRGENEEIHSRAILKTSGRFDKRGDRHESMEKPSSMASRNLNQRSFLSRRASLRSLI